MTWNKYQFLLLDCINLSSQSLSASKIFEPYCKNNKEKNPTVNEESFTPYIDS